MSLSFLSLSTERQSHFHSCILIHFWRNALLLFPSQSNRLNFTHIHSAFWLLLLSPSYLCHPFPYKSPYYILIFLFCFVTHRVQAGPTIWPWLWHWCHNLVDSTVSTQWLPLPQNLSGTESSPRQDRITWNLSWSLIAYCQAEPCAGGDNLSYCRVTAMAVLCLDDISQPSFLSSGSSFSLHPHCWNVPKASKRVV